MGTFSEEVRSLDLEESGRACPYLLLRKCLWHLAEGDFAGLEEGGILLQEKVRRHPELAQLRDLNEMTRVGVMLDILTQALEMVRTLPSRRRVESFFKEEDPSGSRRAVMRALLDAEGFVYGDELSSNQYSPSGPIYRLHEMGMVNRDIRGDGAWYQASSYARELDRALFEDPE